MSAEPPDEPEHLTVTGPAVIGDGVFLAWRPCCKHPVRLEEDQFERWLPVVVLCERAGCRKIWTVEFPQTAPGQDAVAVWGLQLRAR